MVLDVEPPAGWSLQNFTQIGLKISPIPELLLNSYLAVRWQQGLHKLEMHGKNEQYTTSPGRVKRFQTMDFRKHCLCDVQKDRNATCSCGRKNCMYNFSFTLNTYPVTSLHNRKIDQ
ncbi:hypothetical protein Y1Q_0003074 [Alligator mississippiensis]|uniref:Uncharacterized protein n=1 Tax=Alligator mississippiensis TaxID=8496 RepID=A0A151MDC0_ALLMI|nr:hypothetical protein Y1Q_0003074 [Alligator mississippiensis]